jgi:beta-lactamase regulating signal transducer with metallopeptidase domain
MTPELGLQNIGLYSLQIAILSAVAAFLPWAFRLSAPRAQLAFWYAVLAIAIVLPVAEPWYHPPVETAATVTATSVALVLGPGRTVHGSFLSWDVGWAASALLLLVAGAAVRLCLLVVGLLRLRRMRNQAEPMPALPALEQAMSAAGVYAEFLCSADVAGPVTFGLNRPVVLAPPGILRSRSGGAGIHRSSRAAARAAPRLAVHAGRGVCPRDPLVPSGDLVLVESCATGA